MTGQKKKGVRLEFRQNTVDMEVKISIKRRNVWIVLLLCVCIFAIFTSSLSEDVRKTLIDALLWSLQMLLSGNANSRK